MLFLYPQHPLDAKTVDESYLTEYKEAKKQGFHVGLLDMDALIMENDAKQTVKKVIKQEKKTTALYRGWMVTSEQYALLYHALQEKNVVLLNSPLEYEHCHHFPSSYELIQDHTPKSVWIPKEDITESIDTVLQALQPFGDAPLIVKDYVKSRKHEWEEACFIPCASDTEQAKRVVSTFLERQGEGLNGGLVLREFIPFEKIGNHPKSGMPLTNEHRLFFLNKEPILVSNYWEEVSYESSPIPLDFYQEIAKSIESNFFTMDIAKREDGEWMIVELGDGQVAGLPSEDVAEPFYKNIKTNLM